MGRTRRRATSEDFLLGKCWARTARSVQRREQSAPPFSCRRVWLWRNAEGMPDRVAPTAYSQSLLFLDKYLYSFVPSLSITARLLPRLPTARKPFLPGRRLHGISRSCLLERRVSSQSEMSEALRHRSELWTRGQVSTHSVTHLGSLLNVLIWTFHVCDFSFH